MSTKKHDGDEPGRFVPAGLSDYKSAQDKFFERKHQDEEFIEAAEKERQQKYKTIIDQTVKALVSCDSYISEVEARADVIRLMKERRKLPDDYTYPEDF